MIINFLGRTHILILHLPIGILILASLMVWLNYSNWIKIDRKILNFSFGIGTVFAVFSCISGYLLSTNGEYLSDLTNNHKWAGIITATISAISYRMSVKENQKVLLLSTFLLIVGLSITGHLGGSITHGEDFLAFGGSKESETSGPKYEFYNAEDAEIYNDIVVPLLESKCISCHGPNKVKGKLRMDSPMALRAGGKSKKAILGASVSKSEMLRRIMLPTSDSKHMPPKKKQQITRNELEFLQWWIQNGASFDAKVEDIGGHQEIIEVVNKMKAQQPIIANTTTIPSYLPDIAIAEAPIEIIIELRKSDVVVLSAGTNKSLLEVNFVNVKAATDEQLSNLQKLAPHIVHLKLSNLSLSDSDLSILEDFHNLVRLSLDRNAISDKVLTALKNKRHLRYLNLTQTNVSDAGIIQLDSLSRDAKIFASNTQVTLDSLKTGSKIINTELVLETLASDTLRIPEN